MGLQQDPTFGERVVIAYQEASRITEATIKTVKRVKAALSPDDDAPIDDGWEVLDGDDFADDAYDANPQTPTTAKNTNTGPKTAAVAPRAIGKSSSRNNDADADRQGNHIYKQMVAVEQQLAKCEETHGSLRKTVQEAKYLSRQQELSKGTRPVREGVKTSFSFSPGVEPRFKSPATKARESGRHREAKPSHFEFANVVGGLPTPAEAKEKTTPAEKKKRKKSKEEAAGHSQPHKNGMHLGKSEPGWKEAEAPAGMSGDDGEVQEILDTLAGSDSENILNKMLNDDLREAKDSPYNDETDDESGNVIGLQGIDIDLLSKFSAPEEKHQSYIAFLGR
ncbi:hypothetical protein B0H63DRAFT_446042 [Podospora didyma]|uniref:Uncharacterized protein n=1 Tax=Podospora didyma TaxID=330526 RepID=A0AAE0NYH3_9PEZI|nr:hypothetical protein B0H63DRAFT_446042 [Podospora didyma]